VTQTWSDRLNIRSASKKLLRNIRPIWQFQLWIFYYKLYTIRYVFFGTGLIVSYCINSRLCLCSSNPVTEAWYKFWWSYYCWKSKPRSSPCRESIYYIDSANIAAEARSLFPNTAHVLASAW